MKDVNDVERLCIDPAMRHVVGGSARQPDRQAASSSEIGQFATEILGTMGSLTELMNLWRHLAHYRKSTALSVENSDNHYIKSTLLNLPSYK